MAARGWRRCWMPEFKSDGLSAFDWRKGSRLLFLRFSKKEKCDRPTKTLLRMMPQRLGAPASQQVRGCGHLESAPVKKTGARGSRDRAAVICVAFARCWTRAAHGEVSRRARWLREVGGGAGCPSSNPTVCQLLIGEKAAVSCFCAFLKRKNAIDRRRRCFE